MSAALRSFPGVKLVIAFMIPAKVQMSAHKSITTSSAGSRTSDSRPVRALGRQACARDLCRNCAVRLSYGGFLGILITFLSLSPRRSSILYGPLQRIWVKQWRGFEMMPVNAFALEPINPAMSDLAHMKNKRKKSEAELAKGQVWRTGDAYLLCCNSAGFTMIDLF
jgi:hypothetical protein